jgi:hypothetical protein
VQRGSEPPSLFVTVGFLKVRVRARPRKAVSIRCLHRIVRRSKLDWVIVRPVILTSGPKTKAYSALVDPRDWTCGFISRADVADFVVKQIDNDAFLHKTPVLTS